MIRHGRILLVGALVATAAGTALATPESLLAQALAAPAGPESAVTHGSMFAIAPPEPRIFQRHDLVQIIVRETSSSRSRDKMDNKKFWELAGGLDDFPIGAMTNWPVEVDVEVAKRFKGDGKFDRSDELTARVTAEVIEVLPNGNLVLEARTMYTTDQEKTLISLTGVIRAEDVTAANTVLSSQIHDLSLDKSHSGDLKENGRRGVIARVLDVIFAF